VTLGGYVFDAYGTLFDVHSVVEAGRAITSDPAALSLLWRQKQLEYTWLRSLMGRYEDFWNVTESALRHTIRRLGLRATEAQVAGLMQAYLTLACFPEVETALARLGGGRPRAILSNGTPAMLAAAVRSSGLGAMLDHVISVDEVKVY
jgi:2-haloacid dehalogenase